MAKFKKGEHIVRVGNKNNMLGLCVEIGEVVEVVNCMLGALTVKDKNSKIFYTLLPDDFELLEDKPKSKVDWDKEICFKNEPNEILEVLTTSAKGMFSVIVRSSSGVLRRYDLDGNEERGFPSWVIINTPPKKQKKTVWINIYKDLPAVAYVSKVDADKFADIKHRIACVKKTITYSEGQFDKE